MMNASTIVTALLEGTYRGQSLTEASVHLPRRGRRWVAAFTGSAGQQQWKTTGTEDYAKALAIAKEFEAAARAEREKSAATGSRQSIRLRQSPGGAGAGLTQREVALILGLSERSVRAIEKRALRKLAQHPVLRQLWDQVLSGDLDEEARWLSPAETRALLGLAQTRTELEVLRKVLRLLARERGNTVKERHGYR